MEELRVLLMPVGIACIFFGALLCLTGVLAFIGLPIMFLGFAILGVGIPIREESPQQH